MGYKGLQGLQGLKVVTRGHKRIQEVTGVTRGYRGL